MIENFPHQCDAVSVISNWTEHVEMPNLIYVSGRCYRFLRVFCCQKEEFLVTLYGVIYHLLSPIFRDVFGTLGSVPKVYSYYLCHESTEINEIITIAKQ